MMNRSIVIEIQYYSYHFISQFQQFLDKEEFEGIIMEDASNVKDREETDSIMIVDDIRYHISANVKTFSAVQEAEDKLKALDELLIRLGLEC